MSNNTTSYSSTSFSTTTTFNGQTSGQAFQERSHTNPQGTTTQQTSQRLGEPAITETREYDSQGRELLGGGPSGGTTGLIDDSRIQDVTDQATESEADKLYRERMEDEYAKREGGA